MSNTLGDDISILKNQNKVCNSKGQANVKIPLLMTHFQRKTYINNRLMQTMLLHAKPKWVWMKQKHNTDETVNPWGIRQFLVEMQISWLLKIMTTHNPLKNGIEKLIFVQMYTKTWNTFRLIIKGSKQDHYNYLVTFERLICQSTTALLRNYQAKGINWY